MNRRWFSLIGFVGLVLFLILGWVVDRNVLTKQIAELSDSSASSETSLPNHKLLPAEDDLVFFQRWADKYLLSRLAHHYNSFKKGESPVGFENFDQVLDHELVHSIVESFELEQEAIRRDVVPTSLVVAANAIQDLGCSNSQEFFDLVNDLEIRRDVYPVLFDSNSKHAEFRLFLSRVLAEAENLPRAGSK